MEFRINFSQVSSYNIILNRILIFLSGADNKDKKSASFESKHEYVGNFFQNLNSLKL
jgi:hypothetical protein